MRERSHIIAAPSTSSTPSFSQATDILINCSAFLSASGVSVWPLSMRPTSRVRAAASSSSIVATVRPSALLLLHPVMMIGEGRDLRQVGDAQHLVGRRQLLEPPPHAFRRAAPHPRIHLVEDQSADHAGLRPRETRLQRQRETRNLAARRHFFERLRLLAQIRRYQEIHPVRARRQTTAPPRSATRNTVRSMASCASSACTRFSRRRAADLPAFASARPPPSRSRRQAACAPCAASPCVRPPTPHPRSGRALPPETRASPRSCGRTCASAARSLPGESPLPPAVPGSPPAPKGNRAARRPPPASSIRRSSDARATTPGWNRCGRVRRPAWLQSAPAPPPIRGSRRPRRRRCPRSPAASARSAARGARSPIACLHRAARAALSISLRWNVHRSSRRSFSCSLRSSSSSSAVAVRHS